METSFLLPEPDDDSAPFWEGTKRGGALRAELRAVREAQVPAATDVPGVPLAGIGLEAGLGTRKDLVVRRLRTRRFFRHTRSSLPIP